jgi:hypothetical protein
MRATQSLGLVVAVFLAFLAVSSASADVGIYSWQTTDFFPTSLVQWHTPLTAGTTRIGSTNDVSFDPAFSPSGVLWGTNGSSVFTIDTESGEPSAHINITSHIFALNEFLVGVTFSPTGQMYTWSLNSTSSGIYIVNPITGTAAVVTPNTASPIFGMSFGAQGRLYASTGTELVILDPNTGAVITHVGTFSGFVTSLGYGPDGVMRALSPHFGDNGTDLLRVGLLNASTTFLGSSTETLYGVAAIPAPQAFFSLLAVGIACGGRRRR